MEESLPTSRVEVTPAWKRSRALVGMEKVMSTVEGGLNLFGVAFIMVLMFLTVSDVIGRYVFNNPVKGAMEISEMVMAPLVMFGIAFAQRAGGHVRFGLFIEKVLKGRAYHTVEALLLVLALFVFVAITVFGFAKVLNSIEIGEMTGILYWRTWPSKLAIPIGGSLLCLRFAMQIVQHITQAVVGIERRDLV